MEIENNNKFNETLTWVSGYIDAIAENDFIKKNQIEKMISKISNALEADYPFSLDEKYDDLPF
ncbi:hypothetical protein LS48_06430 [Aequorivita aquimaris]|uniref:Uncharacterized protein n=1 Tax=Aequorivita aquimaris TaxID=1548749 RepID=A0A137RIX7_9FLAO|nr:hypothetical protein [Aequorivita aquimaris]KXO00104.1 hypothetical protein LS48_06430 [Aequorivita aquimaris]